MGLGADCEGELADHGRVLRRQSDGRAGSLSARAALDATAHLAALHLQVIGFLDLAGQADPGMTPSRPRCRA